jgi:hypothetical protein
MIKIADKYLLEPRVSQYIKDIRSKILTLKPTMAKEPAKTKTVV